MKDIDNYHDSSESHHNDDSSVSETNALSHIGKHIEQSRFIGRRISKYFEHSKKYFFGTVVNVDPNDNNGYHYNIKYDDGDGEDLSENELQKVINVTVI